MSSQPLPGKWQKCAYFPRCDDEPAFGVSLAGANYLPYCWRHAVENLPVGQAMTIEYVPLWFAFPDEYKEKK